MAKVSWIKRVYFGSPVSIRKTPVYVTFRHASDNSIAPQWKDFEGTQPVIGASEHTNGMIKTFVNPGRYNVSITDGSNYTVLENQVVFLDIDQFDEILQADVDAANDSVVCYDAANGKYVLVSVTEFFNIEVVIPETYNGRIVAERGSNLNSLSNHGCGRLFDYPVYITGRRSDQLVLGDNWIHEFDQFKNVTYISLGNGNLFTNAMYGDIDSSEFNGVPISKAGAPYRWGFVTSLAEAEGTLPYVFSADAQGNEGVVVIRDGIIRYFYTEFGTAGSIVDTSGNKIDVSDYVLMTIRSSSEYIGLSKNGMNIGRINTSGTIVQEWTLSSAWHDADSVHTSWDDRAITYDSTTGRLWVFDPFAGRYLIFDLASGVEVERGVFPKSTEVRSGSNTDRTIFQVRGNKVAQFIRGIDATKRPFIQYYDYIGVSNFSYSTSTTYDE